MQNIQTLCLVTVIVAFSVLSWKYVIAMEPVLEVDPPTVLVDLDVGNNLERQEQEESTQSINEALFSCLEVSENSPPHRPRTEVIWIKDGNVLNTKTKKYKNYGKKKRLLIRDLNEGDSGIYECAFSTNSTNKGRAELWFTPTIYQAPSPQLLEVYNSALIACSVSLSATEVEWFKDGSLIASTSTDPTEDSHFRVFQNGSLIIPLVIASDRGHYRCVASNKAGETAAEIEVILNIPIEPSTTAAPPEETTASSNIAILKKSCVEYEDISFGPMPSVPTLSQPQPNPLSRGTLGLIQPHFTKIPPSCVQTTVGYTIILPCSATGGSPYPKITWTHSDKELDVHSYANVTENGVRHNYIQLPDGSLQITTVQSDDKGVFTCTMTSDFGGNTTSVQLRVREIEEICGVRAVSQDAEKERRKRVVLGEQVTAIEEWPWQVLVEYNTSSQDITTGSGSQEAGPGNNEQLCGGALIRPDWLVTAAHCLFESSQRRNPNSLIVRVGVFNRSDYSEPHQQPLKIHDFVVHPDYSPFKRGSEHDVALVKLVHPVRPSSNTGLICLPRRGEDPREGTLCTVTGWGHLEHQAGVSPELLHKAEVPIVSYSRCRRPESYGSAVTRNMLCAGWRYGGADACQNDSGGPLVCERNGRWGLYGVVNYGDGCGLPHKYGVYAKVTKYEKWIQKIMKEFI